MYFGDVSLIFRHRHPETPKNRQTAGDLLTTAPPLSDEQIHHFKTYGYLILENLIDKATLERWRGAIWNELGSSLDTPDSWPIHRGGLDGYVYDPPESALVHYPPLVAIIDQLGGGTFIAGDGIPIIRWPEPEQAWEMPLSGHIDAYGGRWLPFMLGATTYLYDVEPRGGALIYWPESHHAAHRYFRKYPSHVDGSFVKDPDFTWNVFCDNPETGGREFVANAGTVVLWHSSLTHNGSSNTRHSPRIALFARWDNQRRDETAFRYDVPEDLWHYWAI